MESIIKEAISRAGESPMPIIGDTDKELQEILLELKTNIVVIGCGGSGSNTIQRITEEGIIGAELYAINTDAQHLLNIKVGKKILIGRSRTKGLGAGSLPQIGQDAAQESKAAIEKAGLERLRDAVDTVIVVPNDKLLEVVPHLPLQTAFKVCDEVLMRSVKGITELITKPGLVNLDFADVRVIMQKSGVAMIGLGEAEGENKAIESVQKALRSPLLDVDVSGATGALVNVVGGPDMTIAEAESVVNEIYTRIDPKARLIWGAMVDPDLENVVRTMVVVTGVTSPQILGKNTKGNIATAKYGIDFVR